MVLTILACKKLQTVLYNIVEDITIFHLNIELVTNFFANNIDNQDTLLNKIFNKSITLMESSI